MSTQGNLNTEVCSHKNIPPAVVSQNVRCALAEDIGDGDITATLVPGNRLAAARVIAREAATLCGRLWFDEVFRQLDPHIKITWQAKEGEKVSANQCLASLKGNARNILTGERTALNFLQLISGTATRSSFYAAKVADTPVKLLDTRKTLPGLRIAQKYAVRTGGCHNHRIGLFDAFLIKENHIAACGSIAAAVMAAREHDADKPVEVEVENLDELQAALTAEADIIMLDNFRLCDLKAAVQLTAGRARLEASGGITDETLLQIAGTGVDYISIGTLTKHLQAVDLSMRIDV